MFVLIKETTRILPYILDRDIKYKGINIYKADNNYYIELKNGLYFSDNEKIKLLDIGNYEINRENAYYPINIYVYSDYKGYYDYKLYKNTDFIIANNQKANIECTDIYLKNNYLALKSNILQSNEDIIVNHCKYNNTTLKQGDLIEYLGIKIYYFNDFLYINCFNNINKLLPYENTKSIIKYKTIESIDNYYIPDDICDFEIEEIKEYIPPKKPNNIDFIKSLIPSFIMCLAMCAMAILNYVTNSNNNDSNIASFVIMPASMLMTSVLIPIIISICTNNQYKKDCIKVKQEHLDYLSEYKQRLSTNIEKYINSLNSRYFDAFNNKRMTFYAGPNTNDFMKLSIGHIFTSKNLVVKSTGDSDIDAYLKQIEKIANNIDNYPLYLDIKKNKIITIVSKNINKKYYFNLFLLEVAYKHHYDDISIGIYSENTDILDSVFNLPHLFLFNRRLTLTREEQLQELNQLKLNKPLILFLFDKCRFNFSNENIYIIYFSNEYSDIYKNSNAIVEYINSKGSLYTDHKILFKYSQKDIDYDKYFKYLGRLRRINENTKRYTFSNIFSTNIKENYAKNDHSLKAIFAYSNNELISLDLHESKQGPHGLIGGSTGSGKSELIISLLLSLCIRYSPEYLNIVLIDYKGGGLKESLSYNGITIPHIVCSVSNLEGNVLDRLIIALHNECMRRQMLFKNLSSKSDTSIMNLDDYLDNIGNFEKLAHLLIVVDEFAELKKEKPEQIKELISISRIGRSLGVHLILATQKPAGIIDDEIWSNSRFKIALKVLDEKDSIDIIKRKDAAYLNEPGSFIMNIDGGTIKAKSIYAKNDVYENDPYKVSLLDSELFVDKTFKKNNGKTLNNAMFFSKRIIEESNDYKVHKIDYLPPQPKNRKSLANGDCTILGEIDDYINSKKGLLAYDIKDSFLLFSTRKNEINSILNTLNERGRHSIVIGNKIYLGKYISDSLLYDNDEDIEYLLKILNKNKNNNLTLVVEDISCLLSYEESYLDAFHKLVKRKDNLNISLIFITSTTQLNYKLINAFKNKILININDFSDLSAFYGSRSIYKGNNYYFDETPISFMPINLERYIESKPEIKNIVKHIPEYIKADIKNEMILIGYDEDSKEAIYRQKSLYIVSFNKDLLDIYANAYDGINTYLYNYKLNFDINVSILWLGSGIFNQRLFITGRKDDISDSQGLLVENNKTVLIRRINNV